MSSDWIKELKVGDPVLLRESGVCGGMVKGVVQGVFKQYVKVNGYLINLNGHERGRNTYTKAWILPWDANHPKYLSTRKTRCIQGIVNKLELCELGFLETTYKLMDLHIKEEVKS